MRPIDADRLLDEKRKTKYYHLPNGDIAIPIIDIEHAPTIEPKQGEWIQKKQSIDGKYDFIWTECSECHQRPHDDFESDFCPNCGARMKGADDETD